MRLRNTPCNTCTLQPREGPHLRDNNKVRKRTVFPQTPYLYFSCFSHLKFPYILFDMETSAPFSAQYSASARSRSRKSLALASYATETTP